MNQSVSEVKALPKEPDPPVVEKQIPAKDFTDIKLEYRRIKIQEQCRKLNTNIPSRSSWRDRINGREDSNASISSSAKSSCPETDQRRNLTWGQRRTKVYHINSDVEVHKFKIIDTIHIKRSQIEARLAEYNSLQTINRKGDILMLTYTDQEYLNQLSAAKASDVENNNEAAVSSDITNADVDLCQDPNLDGLSLKDNTKKKLTQFTKNMTDVEKTKSAKSPVPKKKKYNSSVDWREELKNRDRAKQLEDLKRYKVGMPDYKEPEKEKEEEENASDNKWEMKTKTNWKRISLKPTNRPEEMKKEKDSSSKPDEPFKVSLRPVRDRKKNRGDESSSDISTNQIEKESRLLQNNSKEEFNKERQDKKEKATSLTKICPNNANKEKVLSRRNSIQKQEEKETATKLNSKKKATQDQQYVIKVINFVAIKVPVEENKSQPRKKKIERKPSTREKPPIPKEKPPALPRDTLDFSETNELESFEYEIANALESQADDELNNGYLKDLLIEIIRDNPNLSTADVKKAKVQICPKPKQSTRQKDGQTFEDRYFKPKRKKIIDYIPETIPPTLRKQEDISIQPMKFSSVSDNCVTKSLFIGSQYIGQRH